MSQMWLRYDVKKAAAIIDQTTPFPSDFVLLPRGFKCDLRQPGSGTVRCIIDLMHFNSTAKLALFELPGTVDKAVQRLGDPVLKGDYLLAQARVLVGRPSRLPLASDALCCFEEKDNGFGKVRALYTLQVILHSRANLKRPSKRRGGAARALQSSRATSRFRRCA
ncbi:hypothetical protein B0H19DRAFT_1382494 [Mycena capillaripes]|nr:hypothetical protein B0H19DRAFT_1382494 [Mycena capillaripes]